VTIRVRVRAAGSVLRTVVFSAAAVWIASQWNPFYVQEVVTPDVYDVAVLSAVKIPGGQVSPELTDGVRIEQQILLGGILVARDAGVDTLALCVDVPFVTYLRDNEGDVQVELATGALRQQFRVTVPALVDWGSERFCLELPGDAGIPEVLTVTLEGQGAAAGQAVSTLNASSAEITRERLVFPAAVLRDSDAGLPVALPGPLAITTTLSTATPVDAAPLHPFERFERAAILGIPMVVAILVIILLVFDGRRSRPPSRPDAPDGTQRGRGAEAVAAARRAELRTIGTALVGAGVLVLTLGTAPAAADRVPLPLGRQDLGVPSARVVDTLREDQQVEQFLAPSRLPDPAAFARDLSGRQEDVCLSVAVQQPEPDVSEPEAGPPGGSLMFALELFRGSRRDVARIDTVSVADVTDGRVLACFDVNPSQLARAADVVLRVRPDPEEPASGTSLRLQQRRSDETAARIIGVDGPAVADGALDYRFVRKARSYREIVLGRIGGVAVLLGVGILVTLSPRARRSTRRDAAHPGTPAILAWQQGSRDG